MTARPTRATGTAITRPFLVVVGDELPRDKPRRIESGPRRTFAAARTLAIAHRALFDNFFGENGDYFVMRVVDLRDMTVCFEYY